MNCDFTLPAQQCVEDKNGIHWVEDVPQPEPSVSSSLDSEKYLAHMKTCKTCGPEGYCSEALAIRRAPSTVHPDDEAVTGNEIASALWANYSEHGEMTGGWHDWLARQIAQALLAEREANCKAICQGCDEGAELKDGTHFWGKGHMTCQALAIRNRKVDTK